MRRDDIKSKVFTRRALILLGLKASIFLVLISRLYYLQVIKAPKYKMLSDSNRIKFSIIPPLRGKIYDTHKKELATNQNYYRILLDTRQKVDLRSLLTKISTFLGHTYEEREYFIKKVKGLANKKGVIMIYDHLTWEQVARLSAHAPDLPGILIDVAQIRYYPQSEDMSHIIGYVSNVSKEEQENNTDSLYKHPDFKIGKRGIEKYFEYELRGDKGVKQLEVNAYGLPVRELSREDSQSGKDVLLTIDAELQNYVMNRLDNRGSAAVVMDIENGHILALCSNPGFDPNKFTQGITNKEWNALLNDDRHPLVNRTIAEKYPPGSTFKIIVALAIQEYGISPNATVRCPGHYVLGNRRFHCWKKEGHGVVDLKSAIKGSCNVYFYSMAQKIGIDNIHKMAQRFGLGEKLGIPLPGEIAGIMPSRDWKRRYMRESWQQGDTLNTTIGQGYMSSTPLQIAVMMARLANRKYRVTPKLIIPDTLEPKPDLLGVRTDYIDNVLDAMNAVVNESGGTAFGSKIREKKFAMGGKTGTSQVVAKKVNEDKEDEEIKRKNRNHALFVGYAPVSKPKYAVSVVVEHGGSGSRAAAPVARDILHEIQKRRDSGGGMS